MRKDEAEAMTKRDVRTFRQLVDFSAARAAASLLRNDPVACAYWVETGAWAAAVGADGDRRIREGALGMARLHVRQAKTRGTGPMARALLYSRAKWVVILARNNGIVMNPRETGVNMAGFAEMMDAV